MKKFLLAIVTSLLILTNVGLGQRLAFWPVETETSDLSYDYNYEAPKEIDRLVLRIMFRNVMNGRYWDAAALAKVYLPNVEVVVNEEDGYIIFHENGNKGWAHLVISTLADTIPEEVALLVPHDRNDLQTGKQGGYLFANLTTARFLIINGTTRRLSDSARNRNSIFYHYVRLVSDRRNFTRFYSLHGNARKSCQEVFMTDGTYKRDNHLVRNVKRNLRKYGVILGSCGYRGITNLNGQYVRANGDGFVHVEQSLAFRKKKNYLLLLSLQEYYYDQID